MTSTREVLFQILYRNKLAWLRFFMHLSDPVGEPAEHIYSYDRQHQFGDFSMWLLLLFGFVLGPHRFQLAYDERVEHEDEQKGNGKSQDEGIECEGGLPTYMFALWPQDVARSCHLFPVHSAGIHEDGHHQQCTGCPCCQAHHLACKTTRNNIEKEGKNHGKKK